MLKNFVLFCLVLVSCAFSGCSSSTAEVEEEKESLKVEIDADEIEIKGLEETLKKLEESIQKIGDGEEVEVVDFRDLKKMLPEKLAGMERTKHKGSKTGIKGFKFSNAEARYEDDDQELEIKLVDTGGNGFAQVGLTFFTAIEIDSESDEGYERSFEEDGVHYYEKYEEDGEFYSLKALFKERILVDAESRKIKPKKVKRIIEQFKLHKLL